MDLALQAHEEVHMSALWSEGGLSSPQPVIEKALSAILAEQDQTIRWTVHRNAAVRSLIIG